MTAALSEVARPRTSLSIGDACALIVGVMLGAGIFRAPAIVATEVGSEPTFIALWLAGGAVSLAGALCYAELASRHPHAGGEYHFLLQAYGNPVAFLFAWARMSVVQTGAIAAMAFVFGDYATRVAPLGAHSSTLYAAGVVAVLTGVNASGTALGKWLQNVLTSALLLAVVAIAAGALIGAKPAAAPAQAASGSPEVAFTALAVMFVMLTYGGWNEAAYLGGELREPRRNIARALLLGIGVVTLVYVAVNLGYLRVLGLEGLRGARTPAADLVHAAFGATPASIVSVVVMAAAAATINATMFTGARSVYAFGCDQRLFAFLGHWHAASNAPLRALLWQGAVALLLIGLAAFTPDGFETLVIFTAPAFWLFLLLVGVAVFLLRRRASGEHPQLFRTPLYPFTPLVFCAACSYMLLACVDYALSLDAAASVGARLGIAALLLGLPLLWLSRRLAARGS